MNRFICFVLFMVMCSFTYHINAQSKPKRDVSKDRSVIVEKQKREARKKAAQEAAQKNLAKRRSRPRVINTPKRATYLKVNNLMYVNRTIDSKGGLESFSVNTDGESWDVYSVPNWCHITKYYDSFNVSYDANSSHDERSDWFVVRSGSQDVRVNLKQMGAPLYLSAYFNSGQLQHNVYHSAVGVAEKCLNISGAVTIRGGRNLKFLIVAFIVDENNKNIKASYSYPNYGLNQGNEVFVATEVTPYTDGDQRINYNIYLPNNAMSLLKKNNKLQCKISVYCERTSSYLTGAIYTLRFKAKKKRDGVITKDY